MSAGDGIRCPLCDMDTFVAETRQNRGSIRRRRRCLRDGCAGRMTTVEMPAPVMGNRPAVTTELVAVPSTDAVDVVIVPRHLIDTLRKLLEATAVVPGTPRPDDTAVENDIGGKS